LKVFTDFTPLHGDTEDRVGSNNIREISQFEVCSKKHTDSPNEKQKWFNEILKPINLISTFLFFAIFIGDRNFGYDLESDEEGDNS
jgi:hypothetical protein